MSNRLPCAHAYRAFGPHGLTVADYIAARERHPTDKAVAASLGVSSAAVALMVRRRGLSHRPRGPRPRVCWLELGSTVSNLEFARLWGDVGCNALAVLLGRTSGAVSVRALRMGLRQRKGDSRDPLPCSFEEEARDG